MIPERGLAMEANYKNWIPRGMIYGFVAGAAALAVGSITAGMLAEGTGIKIIAGVLGAGALGLSCASGWLIYAYRQFSYNGARKLSKQIIEGAADFVKLPQNGVGLDVGCGSGALTIAAAKRNPHARMVGCDRWGMEYASFSQKLCEENASAENVHNTEFRKGDATKLPFDDESFDCVTSNYVYHNIPGNKQNYLLETLRVLKKGGTFAIHDIMSTSRYGDMKQFIQKLYDMGYEKAEIIPTTDKFMKENEAKILGLSGSAILYGKK